MTPSRNLPAANENGSVLLLGVFILLLGAECAVVEVPAALTDPSARPLHSLVRCRQVVAPPARVPVPDLISVAPASRKREES